MIILWNSKFVWVWGVFYVIEIVIFVILDFGVYWGSCIDSEFIWFWGRF